MDSCYPCPAHHNLLSGIPAIPFISILHSLMPLAILKNPAKNFNLVTSYILLCSPFSPHCVPQEFANSLQIRVSIGNRDIH